MYDYWKTLFHHCLPKRALTCFAGCMANVRYPYIKNGLIQHFIHQYQVNMQEAREENPRQYGSFNEFFIRHLKPEVRPLADADIVSPVDGSVSEIGAIHEGQLLQAKGHYYRVEDLLVDSERSSLFTRGLFATFYLSPKDYHRIHLPVDAVLQKTVYVPGKLFSVQPATVRAIPRLFARNERLVVFFQTSMGEMALVFVGATIVGAIGTSWAGEIKRSRKQSQFDYREDELCLRTFAQGDEIGYFKLGSTVIVLFADAHKIKWLENIQKGTAVQFGQAIGQVLKSEG